MRLLFLVQAEMRQIPLLFLFVVFKCKVMKSVSQADVFLLNTVQVYNFPMTLNSESLPLDRRLGTPGNVADGGQISCSPKCTALIKCYKKLYSPSKEK